VVGGRGYWSQEQVRDGLAYLAALANPLDELALLGALASPFCGVGSDALITLAEMGRRSGGGLGAALESVCTGEGLDHLDPVEAGRLRHFAALLAAEREHAERDSPEVLLERAVLATSYDLAILGRAGGDRRMANLRKLMRLAREYDAAEGRDLRGFIAYATGQDLREAREGEAPLEADDLDAVRLMTIHRAKGLEFPVVAVADLGRQGGSGRPPLLVARDGRVGLRLATLGGGSRVDALDYRALADEQAAAEDEEERRLLYVAMTRAEDLLILSGGVDPERPPAPRPGGAPIAWLLPALLDRPADVLADPRAREPDGLEVLRRWDGRPARMRVRVDAVDGTLLSDLRPASADVGVTAPRDLATAASWPAAVAPAVGPRESLAPPPLVSAARRTTPVRLSYTALQDYARCPYRYYLQRRLGLPSEPVEDWIPGEQLQLAPAPPAVSARVRGVVAHRLLEDLDFAAPSPPDAARVTDLLREEGAGAHTSADVEDLRAMVARFGDSALCGRLAQAAAIRREAPFAFAVRPGVEPLLTGVLDVHAVERDGRVLVVDYKSDRLGTRCPTEVVDSDYAIQRAVYALAVLASGAEAVEVTYCFLERPDQAVATRFTTADAPSLADALLASADGVLEGRWPVASSPHRELCGDCPGRRVLCSHPERLTSRDPRDAHDDRGGPVRAITGSPERAGVASEGSEPGSDLAAASVGDASAPTAAVSSSSSSSGAADDTEL
jgi:hypothetical protein